MKLRNKKTNNALSCFVKASVVSVILYNAFLVIYAFAASEKDIYEKYDIYVLFGISAVAVVLSSVVFQKANKYRKMFVCLAQGGISGVLFLLEMVIGNLFQVDVNALLILPISIFGGILSGLILSLI